MSSCTSAVPVRALTRGPRVHWFGYYDKDQFDPTGRYVLALSSAFEDRQPDTADAVRLGLIDLKDRDRWTEIGSSCSWSWQQGCMLQWRPGAAQEVMWNDRDGDHFVSRLLNIETGKTRTWPWPFYALSPDGQTAAGVDFARLQDMRPECGYPGVEDRNRHTRAPEDSGIYLFDLDSVSGNYREVVSIAQVQAVSNELPHHATGKHYFNHLLFSPDGTRVVFLHRWRKADWAGKGYGPLYTRMFTVSTTGTGLHLVDDSGRMSHFVWQDSEHLLGWTHQPSHGEAFYLFRDLTGAVEPVGLGQMRSNGHCTYLPGRNTILNDTGPLTGRMQELYLYDVDLDKRKEIGKFHSPERYTGVRRVDLHPRASRDGRLVSFDSAHAGNGRQMYLADISGLLT